MPVNEVTWEWATTPAKRHDGTVGMPPIGEDNDEFRQQVLERLEDTEKYPDVLGIIFYQNEDMCSSQFGRSSIMPYGPSGSITDIEAVKADPMRWHLYDLPSQRQYPQWYITREAHLATKAGRS